MNLFIVTQVVLEVVPSFAQPVTIKLHWKERTPAFLRGFIAPFKKFVLLVPDNDLDKRQQYSDELATLIETSLEEKMNQFSARWETVPISDGLNRIKHETYLGQQSWIVLLKSGGGYDIVQGQVRR